MFLYIYKNVDNQYSKTNVSLEDFEWSRQRAQIVLKAEDLEGFRLYASEYA